MSRASRAFWIVSMGVLALELAWIMALPAFRGMDEIDHVFRADSLVHGQLASRVPAQDGRGELVSVSSALAQAARSTCESYTYTLPDNCVPTSTDGDRVQIATAAARYNPTWYALAGTAALPFDGAAADYAMRVATAVVLALLLGWAAAVLTSWDPRGWGLLGLVLTVAPITVYSGATAAPNAVTMGAAVLFWCAGIGVVRGPGTPPLAALTTAVAVMVNTHTTSVMWVAVCLLVLYLLKPSRWWISWFRDDLGRNLAYVAVMATATLSALIWIRWAGTNALSTADADTPLPGARDLLGQQVVWLLQSVGAFPNRDDAAPTVVYVIWLPLVAALLLLGFRYAGPRTRLSLLVGLGFWVVVPMSLTLVSYRSEGYAWQGRYAMPLASGIVLLAALSMTRSGRSARPALLIAVVGTAVAQVCSVIALAQRESGRLLGYSVIDQLPTAMTLVVALTIAGALAPLLLLRRDSTDTIVTARRGLHEVTTVT